MQPHARTHGRDYDRSHGEGRGREGRGRAADVSAPGRAWASPAAESGRRSRCFPHPAPPLVRAAGDVLPPRSLAPASAFPRRSFPRTRTAAELPRQSRAQPTLRRRRRARRRHLPFLPPAPASSAGAASAFPRSTPSAPHAVVGAAGVHWSLRTPLTAGSGLPAGPASRSTSRARPQLCFPGAASPAGLPTAPPSSRSGVTVAGRSGLGKDNGHGTWLGGEGLHHATPAPFGFLYWTP